MMNKPTIKRIGSFGHKHINFEQWCVRSGLVIGALTLQFDNWRWNLKSKEYYLDNILLPSTKYEAIYAYFVGVRDRLCLLCKHKHLTLIN